MPIPSGLSAQLGAVDESTYGTPVTVTKFYEFLSESLKLNIERLESSALRSGTRVLRSDRWAVGQRSVEGSVDMELSNKSQGLWFKHAFGSVVTSQPDGAGAPTVFLHTFTPGDFPTGLTVQVGRTDTSGTTRAFTYHGCKVSEWSLEAAVGEFGKLSVSLLGEDEDTSTGLAVASYPAQLGLMTFIQGSVTVAGAAFDTKSISINGKNGLADDRYFLGSALRKNPLENALREYTGTLEAEFSDLTAYNRFVNGTEAAVVLLFQGATISGAFKYEVKVTMNVRFDGETPAVGGTEVIPLSVPFKCVASGATSDTAIKLEYQTTDTTP